MCNIVSVLNVTELFTLELLLLSLKRKVKERLGLIWYMKLLGGLGIKEEHLRWEESTSKNKNQVEFALGIGWETD